MLPLSPFLNEPNGNMLFIKLFGLSLVLLFINCILNVSACLNCFSGLNVFINVISECFLSTESNQIKILFALLGIEWLWPNVI